MDQIVEVLKTLQGSYSGAFVVFWGLIVCCCCWVGFHQFRNAQQPSNLENVLYWIFGTLMVAFVTLRPFELAPDDLAYLEIYKTICPAQPCSHWYQRSRDWGWHGLVELSKLFYDNPRTMLLLGALALMAKLLVVFNLSKQPMLALALFFGVFYQVQDATALRVSMSLAIYMVGLWLVIKKYRWQGVLVLSGSFVFHKQAFFSPFIVFCSGLGRTPWVYRTLVLLPVLITLMGLYPHIQFCVDILKSIGFLSPSFLNGFDLYLDASNSGAFANWRLIPISLFGLIFLMAFLGKPAFDENKEVYVYASASCILACWLLWGFADIPAAQVRFFEYFALPVVLLAGNCKGRWWEIGLILTVSSSFVYRYNIWTQLFVG